MKNLFILFVLIIGFSFIATAQRDTIRNVNTTAQKVKMKNELGLSKEQAKKMKLLNQNYKEKIQTNRNDSTLTVQQRRERNRILLKEHQSKIDEILTPDQQKKFKALQQEQRKKRKDKNINEEMGEMIEG